MKFSINKSYMKLIEYYLNIFHYVIYVYCIKYKRFLPGYSPSHNSGNILMILTVIPSIIIFNSYLLFYKVNNHPPIIELFLVITIPFYLLVWFSVIHKEKYRLYFKEFKQLPPEIIKKWQKNTRLMLLAAFLLLVVSVLLLNAL